MKKFYLLLIALVCAVCANADSKTAVFDFEGNPWQHGISTSSSTDGVMAEKESLVGSDDVTTLTFSQGSASSNVFRFWQANTGVQMRGYTGNICRVAVPEGGTIKSIVVTGVSGKLFTGSSFETSGTTSSITFEETTESYDITLTGNCQWTRLEVTYDGEDGPEGTVPTFRITCARPTHNNFFAYEGQLCTGLQSSLASYESADNNEWLRFPAEDTDNGYFFYNVGTQQFIGKSTDNIKLPMSTDPTTVYYIWNNNQNSDFDISIGTADGKTSGHILNASSWGAGKDFGARLAPATTCDYDPGNEFQFVETENSITQTEYDAIAKAIHDYYHQPIQLPFELSTAAKTVKYTIVNHHTKGDYYIKTETDGRIRYTQDQNEADRFAFYQGAEEGDGTAYIYNVTTGKYFTWTEDRAASVNWGANPPVLNGVYVEAVDSKDDAKVWFFAAEATEGNYDVLPTSKSSNGWNICGGIEDFTVLNLYDKTDNSSSWSFGEAPLVVVNCAKANTLAQGEEVRLGAFTVAYTHGSYMYIQDESGFALLYAANYGLKAGDQVAAEPGLVVKSSPFKNLPELVPVTAFADIQESVTEGEVGEFSEATEAPSFSNLNSIVKYTGVTVDADVTLAAKSTVNTTWGEGTVTFYNQFAVEGTLEAGKIYTIVAANAVYNENLQAYILSAEEETSTVSVTYNVTFNGQTIKTETKTETVGQAPTFTLEAPAYVTVSTLPETITEETTEVTVTTNLNEQAPFQMQYTYFISVPNGAKEYWFNDNESGKLNELRGTEDGVKFEDLTDNSRWQIGGDWLNGFTLKNVKTGNYVAAGDNHDNGTNVKMGETAEKYTLVKNATGWRLSAEDTYLAHTSANSHIVSYWNVESYNASYIHFYRYEELTKYEQMLNLIDEAKEILDANHVVITGYDEDGYVEYTSLADKVGYKPEVILYDVVDSYDVETYFTEKEEVTDEASFNAAYIEAYSEFGEFWKDFGFDTPLEYELDYIQYAIDVYNAAAICMPEAGKYYTIRNANKFSSEEDGDKEYSYYFTTTTEGTLSLKSMLDATIEHEDIWQAGEYNYDE